MNSAIDSTKLIDHRNRDLFEMVSSKFKINFEPSLNGEHSVYTIQDSMTFYIPVGIYSVDSFSHELLHGYIDYHDVNITWSFKNIMAGTLLLVNQQEKEEIAKADRSVFAEELELLQLKREDYLQGSKSRDTIDCRIVLTAAACAALG